MVWPVGTSCLIVELANLAPALNARKRMSVRQVSDGSSGLRVSPLSLCFRQGVA